MPTPCWVSYVEMVKIAEGKSVLVKTTMENNFCLTAAQLETAITPNTKLLMLCSPNNPTGSVYSYENLKAIVEVLQRPPQVIVLADEIYQHILYTGKHETLAQFPEIEDRLIVINGVSKAYAMTGWRLGYICAPEPLAMQMLKIHQYAIMCAPTTAQHAAVEALRNGDDAVAAMREEYDMRRRLIVAGFNRIGLACREPKGAFYAFPCIRSTGLSDEEFCERLLYAERVAVVPGSAFGRGGGALFGIEQS